MYILNANHLFRKPLSWRLIRPRRPVTQSLLFLIIFKSHVFNKVVSADTGAAYHLVVEFTHTVVDVKWHAVISLVTLGTAFDQWQSTFGFDHVILKAPSLDPFEEGGLLVDYVCLWWCCGQCLVNCGKVCGK